jgi:hypothetical protein
VTRIGRSSNAAKVGRWTAGPVILGWIGPLAVTGAVLVVLHRIAFGGLISNQYADLPAFFWPTGCFLGRSLAAGHIPAWNPHVMGGLPFAADPQSGWMAIVPMALFSSLSCATAIRWVLVVHPIMAGLGLYAFCRSEGLSRTASTTGGLVVALAISGSGLVLNPPFSATFAWTALLLATASRLFRARTWGARVMWVTLAALAWGQLAASHLSGGLAVGTLALVTFVIVKLLAPAGSGELALTGRDRWLVVGLLLLAFPLVNLAFFIPRLAYLRRTSLGLGYLRLDQLSKRLGSAQSGTFSRGVPVSFPLRLHRSPGLYVGTAAALLAFAGLWSKRRRLAAGFGAFALICLILAMQPVARAFPHALRGGVIGSVYLREPLRLVVGAVLALAVLAAVGVDAWIGAGSNRTRAAMLAPGLVVWGLVPLIARTGAFDAVLVAGSLGLLAVLGLAAWRPSARALIPVAAGVELIASCLAGQAMTGSPNLAEARVPSSRNVIFAAVARPSIPAAAYLQEGPIARYLAAHPGTRYLTIAPSQWTPRGYQVRDARADWGLMGSQRSMLFGLEEAQGYNPAQSLRYWMFVREVDPKDIYFNAAGFTRAEPVALDLLDVGYVVRDTATVAGLAGDPVATEDGWTLLALPNTPPRASVVPSWSQAGSSAAALAAVLRPGFDPDRAAVIEASPPGRSIANAGGSAAYRQLGPQAARVVVDVSAPALVLVRNAYDPGWHARVDGRATPVFAADSIDQGVAVPAGHHVIELSYDDPSIGYGLLGSALSLLALVILASLLQWRR